MLKRLLITLLTALTLCPAVTAQEEGFTELPAADYVPGAEVPMFRTQIATGLPAAGSRFAVSIEYPEYAPLRPSEVRALRRAGFRQEAIVPQVSVAVMRKQALLNVSFAPFARIGGKWMRLTSCKLSVSRATLSQAKAADTQARYADHSVLASGRWVKIRVGQAGVYNLSPSFLQSVGFSDPSRVRLYGYGGLIQAEALDFEGEDRVTDDLEEVPLYRDGGHLLFYSEGTVRWTWNASNSQWEHTSNYYSSYAYYFLTESDEAPAAFASLSAPATKPADTLTTATYPVLLDNDAHSWYEGGREMYDSYNFAYGNSHTFSLATPGLSAGSRATVAVGFSAASASSTTRASITLNGATLGTLTVPRYVSDESAREVRPSFTTEALEADNSFRFTTNNSNPARLNYIRVNYSRRLSPANGAFAFSPNRTGTVALSVADATATTRIWRLGSPGSPAAEVEATLSGSTLTAAVADGSRQYLIVNVGENYPTPEAVGEIAPQNLHADGPQDMVIIIPASGKLADEAERLAAAHREHDGLRVKVVRADELYNEFSSGTPDATAYRRYLKMLYDRAENEADAPRYLLLFGDCLWDNRMLLSENRNFSADDFLLAYENSGNSLSIGTLNSYVTDDYFGLLDDGEGNAITQEVIDLGIGRFMCTTPEEAKIYVDKAIAYLNNNSVGSWKNIACFLGDDINSKDHMEAAQDALARVDATTGEKLITKHFFWDVYRRTVSATGYSYPQMSQKLKEQMQRGALMLNYCGHGAPDRISHSRVLQTEDFRTITSAGIPLWVFASCEIAPYDSRRDNIGRAAMLNPGGGAVAVVCASRAVYTTANRRLNTAFCKYVFSSDGTGQPYSMGDALRLTKAELVENSSDRTMNKLKYLLIGDPALRLAYPTGEAVVDSIDGRRVNAGESVQLEAGSKVRISGRVLSSEGNDLPDFEGLVTLTLFDRETTVTCQNNEGADTTPMQYLDRGNALYEGSDSVRAGRFSMEIPIPYDISYSNDAGRLYVYAVNNGHTLECHGFYEQFHLNGTAETADRDTVGPSIRIALDDMDFPNGGVVGKNALFLAEISDDNGINTTGNGLGHDLELTLDGNRADAIVLNDYFSYDFGTYRSGSVSYELQDLALGNHTLELRAWDVNNNSSTARLDFIVREEAPAGFDVTATRNPAAISTNFVAHVGETAADGSVTFEVYDLAGRRLWWHEAGNPAGTAYASTTWNLCDASGRTVPPGIYLYRGVYKAGGKEHKSDTQKIVVIRP